MTKKESGKQGSWEEEVWEPQALMERSNIKRDTPLNCWCPHCDAALNEGDQAVLEIVNDQGEAGVTKFPASLNVLDKESALQGDYNGDPADVRCPHCKKSLIEPGHTCIQDGCKLAVIQISVSDSIKLKLISCTRPTCRWYTMSKEDNERLILRDSHEW